MRFIKFAVATIAALSLGVIVTTAGATTANPVSGTDFRTLDEAQPAEPGKKVEVTEFFMYSCPHCNAFDPDLAEWVKAQGNKITFKRVPVAFHEGEDVRQKLYYALEAMGKTEELHQKIFNAIHVEHKPLSDEKQVADFVASQGIDRARFLDAYNSFGVQAKVNRAMPLAQLYKVDGVPLLAVDGRFETSPSIAGGTNQSARSEHELYGDALKVMDWLVAKQAKERGSQAAATAKPMKMGSANK
jgi:thiol:disulfide interchange protein DsbA